MLIARKTGTIALAAALSLGALATLAPTDASAQYRRYGGGGYGRYHGGGGGWGRGGAAAAGVIGGLALGALAAGAMAPPPPAYPAYGPGYYPAYGGYCTIQRERYWDGWRWRVHRVRVCD